MPKDSNTLQTVNINNEVFFKISDVDALRPFFMSIVSDSNHWMFISSNGGLSAGRKNAEFALLPYYTDDKITESTDLTGSKTIFQVVRGDEKMIWEPFSERFEGKFKITRNLYKNEFGNKIIFEEINNDFNLQFRYEWNSSNEFGFVKKSTLVNIGSEDFNIVVLDGLQNLIPYGVGSELQNRSSNLVDAYKRSELHEKSGLGIFALSAIIVDKAEPSEALKANTVFSFGLENPKYLLSSIQLKDFRNGRSIHSETDVKGEKGAYFIIGEVVLKPSEQKQWFFVANVNQDHRAIFQLIHTIETNADLPQTIQNDIDLGTGNLVKLVASADGLEYTNDVMTDARHFANSMFNMMRGGIFDDNYTIEKWDFIQYLQKSNHSVAENSKQITEALQEKFSLSELKNSIKNSENADLIRLFTEYLPLKFSRRHGDPSRPWNRFSINTRNEHDGSKILDYEGNWRDIFQNWEALAHSFPEFIEGMIFKFLNASTFDGYNPYRVTKDGFDWETIEPDDPWSYIGYWGDHQIIYLLKFLEFSEKYFPKSLNSLLDQEVFVYANVPYKIKQYSDILKNPKDTIIFDAHLDEKIGDLKKKIGADGALLSDENGNVLHVNLTEKILATVLAKLSNFILEGGIWMNTQRPEWNDANNALVGNGVSMVTLYYLRRFMKFFQKLLIETETESLQISNEVVDFYKQIRQAFEDYLPLLNGKISDAHRKAMLDIFGNSATEFRNHVYERSFWGKKRTISVEGLKRFTELSLLFLEHSIKANQRGDGLYHAYNLMTPTESGIAISHLSEMLEGQVAVLSSQFLSSEESLKVLDALRSSALYREDQQSYILYPNKNLKGFLQRNFVDKETLSSKPIFAKLPSMKHNILVQDVSGNYHFNGNFKNAGDLQTALKTEQQFSEEDKTELLQLFEETFNHKEFTGRSGTFYGYEGLGSIYWHMVSKLAVAVEEICSTAVAENVSSDIQNRLVSHFYEITEGIGVHKSPEVYGAFPTDPYSHTPFGKGAQQPGMTGQVKEDLLSRFGVLGISVHDGQIHFQPDFLRKEEFLRAEKVISYYDINSHKKDLTLHANQLFFTVCQVPVIYEAGSEESLEIITKDKGSRKQESLTLTPQDSSEIFRRSAEIVMIKVAVKAENLR